jgi:hypothetical protein
MKKKVLHLEDLKSLMAGFLAGNGRDKLEAYLLDNSQLPGPRANLELAQAFAASVRNYSDRGAGRLWGLLCALTAIGAEEAPVNRPREFLPFCGAVALGELAAAEDRFRPAALAKLRSLAKDSRWRLREAVAMGVQRILGASPKSSRKELMLWIESGNWLEMRAAAAGVAEPRWLASLERAEQALDLHRKIIQAVGTAKDRRAEEFLILRQALGYTLSVVVSAAPVPGFAYLQNLADSTDPHILWILKSNLKKKRLVKYFPAEVNAVAVCLR